MCQAIHSLNYFVCNVFSSHLAARRVRSRESAAPVIIIITITIIVTPAIIIIFIIIPRRTFGDGFIVAPAAVVGAVLEAKSITIWLSFHPRSLQCGGPGRKTRGGEHFPCEVIIAPEPAGLYTRGTSK